MVIAALAADELKRVGVAAFSPALYDAGRLAPQARCAAVARLASSRECREILVVTTRPRVTMCGPRDMKASGDHGTECGGDAGVCRGCPGAHLRP
jgi:hypothetical protein